MKDEAWLPESLHFVRVLWELDHALNKRSRLMLRELGVTTPQRFILKVLSLRPGCTPGQLAKVLHVTPATVTRVVQRMEEAGLLERRTDPTDSRKLRLHLTAAGRALEVRANGPGQTPVSDVLAKLPPARVEEARQLLVTIIEALEAR